MNDLDKTFSALGDETRRTILKRLAEGEVALADLAEPFAMSQTAVSKHVGVLRVAGLVTVEKRGRTRYCRLEPATLKQASDWLGEYESFWMGQIIKLGKHIERQA